MLQSGPVQYMYAGAASWELEPKPGKQSMRCCGVR
jgi:hypothetical protein